MRAVVTIWCVVVAILGLSAQGRTGTLTIHYIDTEGGQSTLFVGPTGESLLVDTGNAGDRDLGRIVETLRVAGVTKIDHLWTTHYHGDHVGALIELVKQFPVGHFYDHGKPHANDRIVSSQFLSAYESLSAGKRTIVKPGDTVKMTSLDITAVAAGNPFIRTNLQGGGSQNSSCAGVTQKDEGAYPDPDRGLRLFCQALPMIGRLALFLAQLAPVRLFAQSTIGLKNEKFMRRPYGTCLTTFEIELGSRGGTWGQSDLAAA